MATPFPTKDQLDIAFGGITSEERRAWTKEAEEAKYNSAFADMASRLFFMGGEVPKRDDVPDEEYERGRRYLHCWLGSFAPKHEDKEFVAGYILSRISTLEKK